MGCRKLSYYEKEAPEVNALFLVKGLEKKGNAEKNRVNYYPFGLEHQGYQPPLVQIGAAHQYTFQGKEKQEDFGFNIIQLDWRNYQTDLGRFFNVDPLAEKAPDWSPYRAFFNNPILYGDPNGLYETKWVNRATDEEIEIDDGIDKTIYVNDSEFEEAKFFKNELNSESIMTEDGSGTTYATDKQVVRAYQKFHRKHNFHGSFIKNWFYKSFWPNNKHVPNAKIKKFFSNPIEGEVAGGTPAAFEIIGGGSKQVAKSGGRLLFGLGSKFQRHHIIPKQIWKRYKKTFKKLGALRDGGFNIKKLPTPFHGNHPQYNQFVGRKIQELAQSPGGITAQGLKDLQLQLRHKIREAHNSGQKLNDYFRQFNP